MQKDWKFNISWTIRHRDIPEPSSCEEYTHFYSRYIGFKAVEVPNILKLVLYTQETIKRPSKNEFVDDY